MNRKYWRCLSAEMLKSRRTVFLFGSILLPTLLAVLNFLLHLGASQSLIDQMMVGEDQATMWMAYHHNTYSLGAAIIFPVVFVFVSTFTAHQEHDTHQWRRLLSMAVSRKSLYLAKITFTIGLCLFACLVMFVDNVILGGIFTLIKPEIGLVFSQMPFGYMLLVFLVITLLGLLMSSLQFYFSMRVNNFVLSIGVGVALVLSGMFFSDVDGLRYIYPWSLPALIYKDCSPAEVYIPMAYSMIGFIVTTYFNTRAFMRQDILD